MTKQFKILKTDIKILAFIMLFSVKCANADLSGTSSGTKSNQAQSEKERDSTSEQEYEEIVFGDSEPLPNSEPKNKDELDKDEIDRFLEKCGSKAEKTSQLALNYPATSGESCPWGQDYNGSRNDDYHRVNGIRVHVDQIEIPNDHLLCGFDIKSTTPNIRYDDYLFLSLSGYLLASTSYSEEVLEGVGFQRKEDFLQFEPAKAIGKLVTSSSTANLPSPQFCLPGATCVLPKSDKSGAFDLKVDQKTFKKAYSLLKKDSLDFEVSITGQAHKTDCGHTGLDFDVILYLVPIN